MLTAAGPLTCRRCGTSISSHMPRLRSKLRSVAVHPQSTVSSHMPLLSSKLRSVTVAEDDVITSSASSFCRACLLLPARIMDPYAN